MTKQDLNVEDLSILIVDDSQVQRSHVVSMCEFFGVSNIDEAENGEYAFKKMELKRYDLAFIDLEMPVMDGVTLLREIANKDLIDCVIILSSKDPILILSVGTMAENDGLKVLGTFKKPLQTSYLLSSLKKLTEKSGTEALEDKELDLTPERLASAIENDELVNFYQPKLRVHSLVLSGVEVLVRWQHEKYGVVPPSKFIPLAERFGFIDELTYKIFEIALHQKKEWNKRGANFNLALNLSPLSLNESGIADNIIRLVKEFEIKPEEIILEVTENAIADQISQSIEVLARLRLHGFQISIDDFGTGYASIQQLSRVPATELKIDRSLVKNIASKPQQQTILENTLNMAADLNLKTVVEGVEYVEDYQYLKGFQIDSMQGFLFAKPMTAKDFESWWRQELAQLRKSFT